MTRGMTAYREINDYDFKATEINYASRERGIGSGYMLIPVEYNDFTDGASLNYYALQEDEIYIKNIFGDVVYRGYITNASALTSAIRLDFNDLSGLTRDKSCKRDYRLYKGSVAVAETNTIKDASASWSANQWNGYGVVCQPGIIPRSVLKAACSTNTGTIGKRTTYTKISGTNLQRKAEHHGFGWGQPDNLSGTYSVPNIPTVAGQGDIYRSDYQRTCSPSNLDKAKALLSEEAVTASTDECVRWYYGTTSGWGGNCYPIADMYINLGEIPVTDVQGFRIKIQGAVRHTNQEANGIHIYIMQYADADNGSGTWEDLSASPAGPIVTLDANNDGVWGVFDYKFELSTGVQGEYINLDEDSWNNYIYEYREYNNSTDTKARHKVMRIMIRGYDDCNGQNGYGMNIGSVQVWLHRVGTDTNQYKITATTAPVTLTVTPDPASTVGMGDILRIAPSLETLYNDISDSEYGYDGYPFVLDVKSGIATEMQNKFLSVNHLGSFHYDIIETIADFGKYNWWFDPYTGTNGYLYIGGDADRGSSGFTFDNTNIPPDGGHLMYPIDNIIGTVFARGNSSLGIVYEKTGSADSSKEVVLKLQGVSSFAELRTFADNLWDKWHLRKPVFSVNLDYNALGSNVRLIKPGMTVTVTYKNLSSEVLPVRRIEVSWEEGKRPQLFVEASEIGTPEEEKIGDKLAKMRARLNRGLNDYVPSDEESTLEIRLKEGKFQKNDDTAVITADGSTPLEDDWFTGDINLTSVMTSFFDQVYENGAISHDGVNDFAMNITSWLFGDLLGLNNPSGSNPTMTAEDSAVVTQLNIPNDVYIDGATSDFQCNYINVNDGSSGITLKDGTYDVVLSKVYNYAELDCIADFKSNSLILDNPSGSDPYLYPEDSVASTKIIIPNDCYIDGAGTSDFSSNNVILANTETGDDQIIWASGSTGYETVEVTRDFKCIGGIFAAETVLLGNILLTDISNNLWIESTSPRLVLLDNDTAKSTATPAIMFMDMSENIMGSIGFWQGTYHFYISSEESGQDLILQPYPDMDSHLLLNSYRTGIGVISPITGRTVHVRCQDNEDYYFRHNVKTTGYDCYIELVEGTTRRAYIQYETTSNDLHIVTEESGADILFSTNGGTVGLATTNLSGLLSFSALDDEDYIYFNTTAASNYAGIYCEGRLYLHAYDYIHIDAGTASNVYVDVGNYFYIRDNGDSDATLIQLNSNAGSRLFEIGTSTDPVNFQINDSTGVIDTILDQDDMSSDDVNGLVTQQSVKAYGRYLRGFNPNQGDFQTGSSPTEYHHVFTPSNTYWNLYYSGTPDVYMRNFADVSGSGPYDVVWFMNSAYGDTGTGMGVSWQFIVPSTDTYTADIYGNFACNTGSYWYFRVFIDSTNKYNGQPAATATYVELNVSLGTLYSGTLYTFKMEQYCATTVGPHTSTFYIHKIVIRPT